MSARHKVDRPHGKRNKRPTRDGRWISGPRFVEEALKAKTVTALYVDKDHDKKFAALLERAQSICPIHRVDREALERAYGNERHQHIAAKLKPFIFLEERMLDELPGPHFFLALDQITDPHNYGAIIRSAVAFGVNAIIVAKHGAAPITEVVARASAGASEHATICQVTNLQRTLQHLAQRGHDVIGLDGQATIALSDLKPSGDLTLVVGSEGKGMRRMVKERCSEVVKIPFAHGMESLNASNAAAIALYALYRART